MFGLEVFLRLKNIRSVMKEIIIYTKITHNIVFLSLFEKSKNKIMGNMGENKLIYFNKQGF
jgi:hypothetical protein